MYFTEPPIDVQTCDDPLSFWKIKASTYPALSALAKKFLSAPLGSVSSEREFKVGKQVITDTRSSLLPHNAEKLVFLSYNLRAFGIDGYKILKEYESCQPAGQESSTFETQIETDDESDYC